MQNLPNRTIKLFGLLVQKNAVDANGCASWFFMLHIPIIAMAQKEEMAKTKNYAPSLLQNHLLHDCNLAGLIILIHLENVNIWQK